MATAKLRKWDGIPLWVPVVVVPVLLLMYVVVTMSVAYAHHAGGTAQVVGDLQPGAPMTIVGDGFPGGERVTITLESGEDGVVPLGTINANSAGEFVLVADLAADLSPGAWKLAVAFADDKNFTDVTVLGADMADEPVEQSSHSASPASSGTTVIFERSTGEVVTIGIIIGLLALLGTALILVHVRQGTQEVRH